MRDRGYNFPDPTFDGGRVTQKMEKGDGDVPGPDDPGFEQDREECRPRRAWSRPTARTAAPPTSRTPDMAADSGPAVAVLAARARRRDA